MKLTILAAILSGFILTAAEPARVDYRVLATTKTSSMEKEMNEAARSGYSFKGVMGGQTAFGGKEMVVVMAIDPTSKGEKVYKVLAANRTGTIEKEMSAAGEEGFEYKGQTIYQSTFGGEEVVLIMERDKSVPSQRPTFKLLSTSKTSTLQKELGEAGTEGYQLLGMTVAKTAFGGHEVLCILRKAIP